MKIFSKITIALLACLMASHTVGAQIYSLGNDQGNLKWNTFRTDEFRLIYPSGLDSLAHVYANSLEKYRHAVGRSIGVDPNQMYRKPLPVILHSQVAAANGLVSWAPRRMELYTGPEALNPEPLDWVRELAIHESRHVAQMQLGRDRFDYKVINKLFGDALPGILSGIYPNGFYLEGDAVVAETGLTDMGRGRNADFLEYYMAAFSEGKMRDWYQWRYGSLKYYTPNYYTIGYLTIGGTRYVYDCPDFSARYFSNISSGFFPFRFLVLNKTLKQTSGMRLRKTWKAIEAAQDSIWQENIAARGPFKEAEKVTETPKRYTQYVGTTMLDDELYSVSKGIATGTRLVKLDENGKAVFTKPFSSETSSLMASEPSGRIYWSEITPDLRWTLKETSRIRYMEEGSRKFRTLTRKGRLFNPAPSPDGKSLSVTEYPTNGGTAIEVIDANDGHIIRRYQAPDSLQVVESAWQDGKLFATAISYSGFGIYDVTDGYSVVVAPQPTQMSQLRSSEEGLLFVSDRLGVNELYCLDGNGSISRLTNNKIGASEFVVAGDSLYFSALTTADRGIYKEKLSPVGVEDYSTRYHYPIADRISEQEEKLVMEDVTEEKEVNISDAKRYRKVPHLFRFHSWTPFYVEADAISDLSFDDIVDDLGFGFMAMYQNNLGTASGSVGYSAVPLIKDEGSDIEFRNALHARFSYSGRYPVFELKMDVSDRDVYGYNITRLVLSQQRSSSTMKASTTGVVPYVSGSAKVYVPLCFTSGGWTRGLIPQVNLALSNDYVNTTIVDRNYVNATGTNGNYVTFFDGAELGEKHPFARLSTSIRGYVMTSTPSACSYPRWGIGAETGVSMRPGFSDILCTNVYGYAYGYVPGLLPGHGIRLTAMTQYQQKSIFKEMSVSVLPRGFESTSEINRYIQARYPLHSKFSIDYAMPLLNLDWSGLGRIAYVKNIDLRPHFDYSAFGGSDSFKSGNLFSVGTELCVNLGNFAMMPASSRFGISYSYNGGKSWDAIVKNGATLERNHFELVMTMSL